MVADFGSIDGFIRFGAMVGIAGGSFAMLFRLRRFRAGAQPQDWILLSTGVAFAAISAFGAGDTDRILTPAGLLLCLSAAGIAVREPGRALPFTVVVAAYLLAQAPFTVVGASGPEWITFFSLRDASRRDLINNGIAPVLIGLPLVIMGLRALSKDGQAPRDQAVAARP